MRFRSALLYIVLLAALVAAGLYGVFRYRYRFVQRDSELVTLLPPGDLTLFYADLGAIRQAGLLRLLANIKPAPDDQYQTFLNETGFDFARDLSALAGAYDADHLYFVGRGEFHWTELQVFAQEHGGMCGNDYCQAPGTTAGKWANFIRIQPDVVALAVSSDRTAADALRPPGRRLQGRIPNAPLWVSLSRAIRTNPTALPLPVQMFAISVQSAEEVMLWLQPAKDGGFELRLSGEFPNAAAADTAKTQLQMQTGALKRVLKQESQLTGLLTGGWFQSKSVDLTGGWPVKKDLVRALQ